MVPDFKVPSTNTLNIVLYTLLQKMAYILIIPPIVRFCVRGRGSGACELVDEEHRAVPEVEDRGVPQHFGAVEVRRDLRSRS